MLKRAGKQAQNGPRSPNSVQRSLDLSALEELSGRGSPCRPRLGDGIVGSVICILMGGSGLRVDAVTDGMCISGGPF
jgi:hypothetical protein